MKRGDGRCFESLQAFARTLNHALRTPLAVISNDLHFLAPTDQTGVVREALTRCRDIGAVLERAAALGSAPLNRTTVSLQQIAAWVRSSIPHTDITGSDSLAVEIDRERWGLIIELAPTALGCGPGEIHAALDGESGRLVCSFTRLESADALYRGAADGSPPADNFERLFIEAVVGAHGGECTFEHAALRFTLPGGG